MIEPRLTAIRDGLLRWKRDTNDRETKLRISELLDIVDEHDREDARFAEWCGKHAPNWEATELERLGLLVFLTNGDEGLSREEVDAIKSGEDDEARVSASIGRVRTFVRRLRQNLEAGGSTVEVIADRKGIYRTTDPSIVTLGDVPQPGDRQPLVAP